METNTQQNGENTTAAPVAEDQAVRFEAGFRRVEALIRAVPEEDLETINLDIPSTVATVAGAFDEIVQHRSALQDTMPTFDLKHVDNLRDYALALGYAHVGNRATQGPVDPLSELATQLAELRDVLHDDGTALANRKLLSRALLDVHRGGNSYRMIAFDVLGLVKVFKDNWAQVGGKTALTLEELEQATGMANELVLAVGRKEQAPPAVNDANVLRSQAYTLLVRAYTEVRDALKYIRRRQGDVDKIAPSLWANRGRRPGEQTPVSPVASASPALAPGLSTLVADAANKVPVGFPGSDPLSG